MLLALRSWVSYNNKKEGTRSYANPKIINNLLFLLELWHFPKNAWIQFSSSLKLGILTTLQVLTIQQE